MAVITIRVRETDKLYSDGIENFSIQLKEETKTVLIYHREECLGSLVSILGLTDDEFINQITLRATNIDKLE